MINEVYENYKSDNERIMTCKDYFTDRNGYLNEYAFKDFIGEIRKNGINNLYLCCFNIDLRKANLEGHAMGDYILRKFIVSLEKYYVFRIGGEKFNILCKKEQIPELQAIFDKENEKYRIYYGFVKEKPFFPQTEAEEKEMIRKGISLMYACKGEASAAKTDFIIGDKGNTPKELQETSKRKFRSTMWYVVADITVTKPEYRTVKAYIYPTEIRSPKQSIPIIVIVDNNINYIVRSGYTVEFGVCGIRFCTKCHFDAENHLQTWLFSTDTGGEFDIKIRTVEGVCIPANFGKRLKNGKEIYPIKPNITGMWDFVIFDDGTPTLNTDGYFTDDSGVRYGVYMDKEYLNLVEL